MSCMAKTTISMRELQRNLKGVMTRVERGQVIEVTRRRRPIARIAPMRPIGPLAPWPDLEARARDVFGERMVAPGGSELVVKNRGEL
jgi:prevent-host-death family protein